MTCRHTRSVVLKSHEEGSPGASRAPFRYVMFRRRRCRDCGFAFGTFELTEDQMEDRLLLLNDVMETIRLIAEEACARSKKR